MTTLLLDRNFRLQAKYQSISPRTSGFATNCSSSTSPLYRVTQAGTLQRDQFVCPAKSQSKWYGVHAEPKKDSSSAVKTWNTGSSHINSTYFRITRQAGIASNPPLSRPISQENLRKWEKSARESSINCNQAAGFNHCLLKIQQNMQTQLYYPDRIQGEDSKQGIGSYR